MATASLAAIVPSVEDRAGRGTVPGSDHRSGSAAESLLIDHFRDIHHDPPVFSTRHRIKDRGRLGGLGARGAQGGACICGTAPGHGMRCALRVQGAWNLEGQASK